MLSAIALLSFSSVTLVIIGLYRLTLRPELVFNMEDPLFSIRSSDPTDLLSNWERAAGQAGLSWTRQTYYFIAGVGLGLAVLFRLLGQPMAAYAGALAGLIGPYYYVRRMQAARLTKFTQQLPHALFLAASVLRAGGTLLHAVDAIANEMPNPMGREFRWIQHQMRLHVPAHEAMAVVQDRVGVPEFAAVVMAGRITVEVGGNLAHIFDQIARSLMDAQNGRRTVQSFTTEGRMSANIITGLPFFVMAILYNFSPAYLEPFFNSLSGQIFFITCVGTILLGWFTIRRMVDIRTF